MDCIFCKIAEKKIPSTVVYEDEDFFAFKDINPEAPVHILIIPKKHISSMDHIQDEDKELMGKLSLLIKRIAGEQGVSQTGYRVVTNVGEDGGQTVNHLHIHLLGGRSLQWPPG